MSERKSQKPDKWWKKNPFRYHRTTAPPAPSRTPSTVKPKSPSQGDVERGTKASSDATGPHAPPEPSAPGVQTTGAGTDGRGKELHYPAAASTIEKTAKSPPGDDVQTHVPLIEPRAEGSHAVTEPIQQQSPALSISQRVWNAAYDNLATGNAKLVESYVRTLAHVLETEASEESMWDADNIAAKLKDPSKRQEYLTKLVVQGQKKVTEGSKIMKAVGGFANAILVLKPTVDILIQNIPQAAPAALPWGGFCVGLQILSTAAGEVPSNLAGITHVVSRMDWYCALTEHLLNKEKIMIGNESFEAVLEQLKEAVIKLYEGLLLYQMKTVCFYYQKRDVIFLRALVGLDNLDRDLKSVTDFEDVLQKYSEQYHKEYNTSALYQLVQSGKETEGLLSDIRQDLRQLISAQEKNRSDDTTSACLRALRVVDPQTDMEVIEGKKGDKLLEDTYKWIIHTKEYTAFTNWDDNRPDCSSNQLLWIKGEAGTGKTMLMISIIRKLFSQPVVLAPRLSFFFCQGGDASHNDATAVLRSLIWLLLIQQPRLIKHLLQKYKESGPNLFTENAAFYTLRPVFQKMLKDPDLSSVYLAVDALDECEDGQEKLIELILTSLTLPSRVKWLVSSRPSVKLESPQTTLLELNAQSLERPVNSYIDHMLLALDYDKDTLAELSSEIRKRAMNTFLWVALVFKELRGRSGNDAVRIVREIPPGLSKVYNHIMTKIGRENKYDEPRCKDVLAAISLAYRPLSLLELAVLADLEPGVTPESIIKKCGSFLTTKENTVYLIHQSARDYLKENFESKLQKGGVVQGHEDICKRSILAMSDLKKNIYALRGYGFKPKDLPPPDPDPLVPIRYSSLFWVDHLCDANSQSLDFKEKLADDKKTWELFNNNLCDNKGGRLRLEKELIDNGATWKFFNDHLANHQGLDKQLAYGGAVWMFFNDHLRDANGRGLKFKEQLATGKTVWKFFNDHLVNHQSPDFKDMLADGGVVETFFNDHFLHWLESLSLLGELSAGVRLIRKLLTQLQPGVSPGLVKFLNDAERFVLSHGSIIERAPLQTYGSALVFSPMMSEVRNKQWEERLSFIKMITGIKDYWSAHQQTLEGHSHWVEAVAFSPDGKTLASASADDTIQLWDAAIGAHQQTLKGHSNRVRAVAFSPDSKTLVSASDDCTIQLWDVVSGAHQQMLKGHRAWVRAVAFSPDGKMLVSASDDFTVQLWDAATGIHQQTLKGHSDGVWAVSFSPNGKILASASFDNTVQLWDVATGTYQQTLKGHSDGVLAVAFSPNGKILVSASSDNTIRLWDAATGTHQQILKGHGYWVRAVAFSPDSKMLASASDDLTVQLWDVATGAHQQTLKGHSNGVRAIAFSPDGKILASASADNTIRLWDVAIGAHQQMLKGHRAWVRAVAFSPDGKILVSASDDDTIQFWDAVTGVHQQTLKGHEDGVWAVTFSPDGKILASLPSASSDHTIQLWDVATGTHQQTLKGYNAWVMAVIFSPDSKTLASIPWTSSDHTIQLWDTATGAHRQTLKGHSAWVKAVTFSPDGKILASASNDHTIRFWDAAIGTHQQTLEGHSAWVRAVIFSPNGKTLASASNDHTIRLWDTATGAHQQTLKRHRGRIGAVAFSPDGKTLASASDNQTIQLWDTATGVHQQTIKANQILSNLVFSEDGQYLKTTYGLLKLSLKSASLNKDPEQRLSNYALFVNDEWVTLDGKNFLWLPKDYRATCVAVYSGTLVLGHESGGLTFLQCTTS